MKAVDIKEDMKRLSIVKQLEQYGVYDNEGYTYEELKRKLTVARALDVKVKSPHGGWF